MTDPVPLHPQEHKDLRIITRRAAALGDAVMACPTFPLEFRDVQAHYPIVFRRAETGYEALALFGFEQGENLFLGPDGEGWDAPYIPLAVRRQPFLVGVGGPEPVLHIDTEHPRVSRTEGEALFLKYGGTTEYLEEARALLGAIHEGLDAAPAFFDALGKLDLLVSFTADLALASGEKKSVDGFYTVDEERLAKLSGTELESLLRAGHLEAAYMVIASLSALRHLVTRKDRRHAAHA